MSYVYNAVARKLAEGVALTREDLRTGKLEALADAMLENTLSSQDSLGEALYYEVVDALCALRASVLAEDRT
jgi:hypothetical protein